MGAEKHTQNILNIQPVIPFSVTSEWNSITRTIIPVIFQPAPAGERVNGIGDMVFTAFLSTVQPGNWIWGAGSVLQLSTNSSEYLGNRNWWLGTSAVLLHLEKVSPWVYRALVNNVWSLADDEEGGAFNNGFSNGPLDNNQP